MTKRVSLPLIATLIFGNAMGQNDSPCIRNSIHLYGDTIVRYYPNCRDTTTYSERRYNNGRTWRNEDYAKNMATGFHWYPGDPDSGSQWILFDSGAETTRIWFYPRSGNPRFMSRKLDNGTWHTTNYYPNGNPRSDGKELSDPSGVRVARTRVEYDSTGNYSIGEYYPVEIYDTTRTINEQTGDLEMVIQLTDEVRHGVWTEYDRAGNRSGTRKYAMGVLVSQNED